jgi:hypothetical protein
MNKITKHEDEWQTMATEAAIGAARKIANNCTNLPPTTPVGKLTDAQWGWIITAAIFGWIEKRCEQAIAEGLDQEAAVRMTELSPSPSDVAVVTSILLPLGEQTEKAGIDWSLPLAAWTENMMTNFLMRAWKLIRQAEAARDSGKIIHPSKADFSDPIPF